MAAAAVAAMPLVFCSLIPWFARADGSPSAAVGVVDAFDNARAVRDVNAVAALLDADASVVDSSSSGESATGPGSLSTAAACGDGRVRPRTQTGGGEVTWTETVGQTSRPSWENNLNWWMDGNGALEAEVSTASVGVSPVASGPQTGESGPAATRDARVMRAIVTQGRITRLTMTRGADLLESSTWWSELSPQKQQRVPRASVVGSCQGSRAG